MLRSNQQAVEGAGTGTQQSPPRVFDGVGLREIFITVRHQSKSPRYANLICWQKHTAKHEEHIRYAGKDDEIASVGFVAVLQPHGAIDDGDDGRDLMATA